MIIFPFALWAKKDPFFSLPPRYTADMPVLYDRSSILMLLRPHDINAEAINL